MLLTATLMLIGASPTFEVLDAWSDVRAISPNGRYVTGALWTGTSWKTALWDGTQLVKDETRFSTKAAAVVGVSVTDSRDVVAYQTNRKSKDAADFHGYLWRNGDALVPVLGFPGYDQIWERAIARDGSFSVGFIGDDKLNWAVMWKRDGTPAKLPTRGKPELCYGEALGISGNRRVIVGHVGGQPGHQAAVWKDMRLPTLLGDLPGGLTESFGWAANFDGSIVVGHGSDKAGRSPVRWVNGKGPMPLGGMPKRFKTGMARAVSDDGKVIAGIWDYGKDGRGFVWTNKGGTLQADAFLRSKGLAKQIGGLTINSVMGVSADGHTLTGSCTDKSGISYGYRAHY